MTEIIDGIPSDEVYIDDENIDLSKLNLKLKDTTILNKEQIDFLLNSGNKIPEGEGEIVLTNTNLPELLTDEQIKFLSQ